MIADGTPIFGLTGWAGTLPRWMRQPSAVSS
jgi:hypothetical protein